jgi:hypothetical protein
MKTYRVYGEYIQRVYIDVPAEDHELAQDDAADRPLNEWTLLESKPIDITEVEYA